MQLSIEDQKLFLDSAIKSYASDSVIKLGYNICTSTIEKVGIQSGYNIQGFSTVVAPESNPKISYLLKIIEIRNSNLFEEISPEWQLIGILITTGVALHNSNSNPHTPELKTPTKMGKREISNEK